MFKTSIPLVKVGGFSSWCDYFDTFCALIKNEDILDHYSEILEFNNENLVNFQEGVFEDGWVLNAYAYKIPQKLKDIRLVIEGSKDHKTIRFSLEGKNFDGEKTFIPAVIFSKEDFLRL